MKRSYWVILAILGGAVLLILCAGIIMVGSWINVDWGMMGGWPSGMMDSWGFDIMNGWGFVWIGMLILMLLIPIGVLVLIVLGVIALVRGLSTRGQGSTNLSQPDALSSPSEILQMRYASGEITREQYLEMRDDLS